MPGLELGLELNPCNGFKSRAIVRVSIELNVRVKAGAKVRIRA